MGADRKNQPATPAPPMTPEGYERRLSLKAMQLAERQLEEGTASAQVITHFLKAASSTEQLNRANLEQEIEWKKARSEALAAEGRIENLFNNAIKYMRAYQGEDTLSPEDTYDD